MLYCLLFFSFFTFVYFKYYNSVNDSLIFSQDLNAMGFFYDFLSPFFSSPIVFKSLSFYDNIYISTCQDFYFFESKGISFDNNSTTYGAYIFSMFYDKLFFDPYVFEEISLKPFFIKNFNYAAFDVLARSQGFEDYYFLCSFSEGFYDYFFESFYLQFFDYFEPPNEPGGLGYLGSLELLALFNDAVDVSVFTDSMVESSLSFDEFLFLEGVDTFEDFF